MNRKVPLTALMLLLMACGHQDSPVSDTQVAGSVKTKESYTLEIVFHGLVAYAEDKDKVWAFLVDADYTDLPRNNGFPPEESLPPGVLKKLEAGDLSIHEFPIHRPRLRLKNGEVISGPVPHEQEGLSIQGADLRFDYGKRGFSPPVDLSKLSDAAKIVKARGTTLGDINPATFDQLDPVLLGDTVDARLAARVRIEAGSVVARPVGNCKGEIKLYSYKTLDHGSDCPGKVSDAYDLAEEVVVTQKDVSQPTEINLGGSLGALTVRPRNPDLPLKIEILNQTQRAIDAKVCLPEIHRRVFLWYYRLLPQDAAADVDHYVFPCVQHGKFGDPKCPQTRMFMATAAKKGER